jgi:hypothetical protein
MSISKKAVIQFKKPVLSILKQLEQDKKDIQQKMRAGQYEELKVRYKVVQPL